jgi:hypothetical protein
MTNQRPRPVVEYQQERAFYGRPANQTPQGPPRPRRKDRAAPDRANVLEDMRRAGDDEHLCRDES